jgi:hypothetical protein
MISFHQLWPFFFFLSGFATALVVIGLFALVRAYRSQNSTMEYFT